MKQIACIVLLFALVGCQPSVSEQDLGFLATQKKPLTYRALAKRIGDSRPGPGPYYGYSIRGSKKTVEFWFGPPPAASQASPGGIPVEIAVAVERTEDGKPRIIWPDELQAKNFDEVIAASWPRKP